MWPKPKTLLIVGYEAGGEGIKLIFNEPARLKTGNVSNTELWVSWDKIGDALVANYCDIDDVAERRKIRKEKSHE
jgi:hypothetical protein